MSSMRNMLSAAECQSVMSAFLSKECTNGWVLGSFNDCLQPKLHVSRLGVVPKHMCQVSGVSSYTSCPQRAATLTTESTRTCVPCCTFQWLRQLKQ